MKKTQAEEITIWDCPYEKCREENTEHHTFIQEGEAHKCRKCGRKAILTFE